MIARRRPYSTRFVPAGSDPYRRLFVAVAVRALFDVLWPTSTLAPEEQVEAERFVIAHQRLLIHEFNIPANKVQAALARAEEVAA